MGKLHSLRREIRRNPAAWSYVQWTVGGNLLLPTAAGKWGKDGRWKPWQWSGYRHGWSYRAFVRKVLLSTGVGLTDVGAE